MPILRLLCVGLLMALPTAVLMLAGCQHRPRASESFTLRRSSEMGREMGREGAQMAHEAEVVKGQLRHARLDLQQATTPEEQSRLEHKIIALQAHLEAAGTAVLPSSRSPTDEQRLHDLERQLQFTEDHAQQEQLALEIARLRKSLSKRERR